MVFSYGAQGALVSFDLSVEFSGATPPAGAAPWLNATFDDGGLAGAVTLTLTTTPTPTTGLTGAEFVSNWMFNLDPGLDPTELIFSSPTKTGGFDDPVISTGVDAFKADGTGYFDIWIAFEAGGGVDKRFGAGEAVEYTITGIDSLTAESFDFLCTLADHGPFPTAAHVQSIGDEEDSGWTTVPEPATLSLLILGGLTLLRRKRGYGA
ncbi:MAG: PEP-CTERM sorting domain-containing protein [Phycisphaerae bacterium]|nr:PEP-CTERM sorting domain-containing protein [Phycisphaerae bacterium]